MGKDILAISDIHLGSFNSEIGKICKVLDRAADFRTVVINGDLLDGAIDRLDSRAWRVLDFVGQLGRRAEVVWAEGNHDIESIDELPWLLGIASSREFTTDSEGTKFHFEHGHLHDDFIWKHPYWTALGDWAYLTLQVLDPTHCMARWAKKQSKNFLNCAAKTKAEVIVNAEKARAWGVAGHVHQAEIDFEAKYVNLGSFTERPCSYLEVVDGVPSLKFI